MLGGLWSIVTVQHFQIHCALVQDGTNNWGRIFLRKKKKKGLAQKSRKDRSSPVTSVRADPKIS